MKHVMPRVCSAPFLIIVGDTDNQTSKANSYPPITKAEIMRRSFVWFVQRMWADNPAIIKESVCKETMRFSHMVIGFPAVDLL